MAIRGDPTLAEAAHRYRRTIPNEAAHLHRNTVPTDETHRQRNTRHD